MNLLSRAREQAVFPDFRHGLLGRFAIQLRLNYNLGVSLTFAYAAMIELLISFRRAA
jgi:hypothetical protein